MSVEVFSKSVQRYLRNRGYTQQQLASELGLHPKVLSRKMHSSGKAHLTHREVQHIITILAGWQAITTRDEALHLLTEAGLDATIFDPSEWLAPPLNKLVQEEAPTFFLSHNTSRHARLLRHNLPAPTTRLIGRKKDVARLQQLFERREIRLVTLFGPGGSGKTRLALFAAAGMVEAFSQGVWLVSLAGVSDPELVPMSILQALNITPTPDLTPLAGLIAYLRDKHMLLLLDNFEHVLAAKTAVDKMLVAAPDLKVLITSREVLHLYGEYEFSVPPLEIPDPRAEPKVTRLAQCASVRLFLERAQAVRPDFTLDDSNAASVAQICARVDGLPLALELAAARIKVLSSSALLEQLTQSGLAILTGGASNLPDRQQTLLNTIEWSYNLLTPVEQKWFRRLGVLTGNWTLEVVATMMLELDACEERTSDALTPVDLLERLVDKSLLIRSPVEHGQMYFGMLSTLREYALEQLAAHDELELVRDWHAFYYLRQAEKAELGLRGPQQLNWRDRVMAERDNFRAALEWSLQRAREGRRIRGFVSTTPNWKVANSRILSAQEVSSAGLSALELCLRLAAALRHYWEWQGHMPEARHWLNAALAIPFEESAERTVLAARARALSETGRLIFLQNQKEAALKLVEQSMALWRQLDDKHGLAGALLHRGWVAHGMAEYEVAQQAYFEGMEILPLNEDPWLYGQLLLHVGDAAAFLSDHEQMHACHARCREIFEQIGDRSAVADVWKDHGGLLMLESRWDESIDCLLKSMRLCYELSQKEYLTTGLDFVSLAVGLREKPDPITASLHSAKIQGAANHVMEMIGLNPWTETDPFAQAVRQHIRSRVSEQEWETAWSAGHELTLEEGIELAYRLGQGLPEEAG